jgi:hypothetical protein
MPITIDLSPELERQLREKALAAGIAAEDFVVHALAQRLEQSSGKSASPSHLSTDESLLLQEINQGLPEASWRRYHDLIAKRRAETLTEEEHAELKSLTAEVEMANVRRLEKLIALARLRQVHVKSLMEFESERQP